MRLFIIVLQTSGGKICQLCYFSKEEMKCIVSSSLAKLLFEFFSDIFTGSDFNVT